MHCPLDCEYLEEARKHEVPAIADGSTFPNADIPVTEQFLRSHEPLLLWMSVEVMRAAIETPGAVDNDLKDALEALVKTYRTLQSGLVYESRPPNALAAALYGRVLASVDEFRKLNRQSSGMQTARDVEVLGILAFLQRMEIQQNNGRRLGRAFVDFLRTHFPQNPKPVQQPSLIL